jgi:hypothetical protein
VKLLYAVAFALFPLTACAQTPDAVLLTALCHDDYFEDTAGQCKSLAAGEDLTTAEAILARYGEIISSDADDESVFYLTDPEDVPVGAIQPRQVTPSDNAIDDDRAADLTNTENTVAEIDTTESPRESREEFVADVNEVATTGITSDEAAAITTVLSADEDRTVE